MIHANPNRQGGGEDAPEAFVRAVVRYLDGLSSPEEFVALKEQLNASADRRRVFVHLCVQARAMAEGLGARELVGSEVMDETLEDETLEEETPDVFLEVIEQALHARAVHEVEDRANKSLAEDFRLQRVEADRLRALPVPVQRGPRVIVIPKALVYLGSGLIAALLVLTVYLVAPARPTPPTQEREVAEVETPSPTPRVQPGTPNYVAVLEQISEDAEWADQSTGWVVGMQLEAGEIHLTQGAIGLRLLDGAAVTLEAPVRFSVLGTNQSELHLGQLSAVVPESAHGFEVLVPGGVVTDLGTAFHVQVAEAMESKPTHVEVTEGVVTVATRRSGRRGEALALTRNQFAAVPSGAGEIRTFEYTDQPVWIDVSSTGLGLAHGQADRNWTIRANDDPRAYPAITVAPEDWNSPAYEGIFWLPGDVRRSHWIALAASGWTRNLFDADDGSGTLTFSTTLDIPGNIDHESVELRLKMIADNRIVAIRVNGQKVAGPIDLPPRVLAEDARAQYQTWLERTLTDCFQNGENTLEFEVYNESGASGLRVEMTCLGVQVYSEF